MADSKPPSSGGTSGDELTRGLFASANSALNSGQTAIAKAQYQKIIELKPDNAEAFHLLGLCHYKDQEWTFAVDTLKKSLELSPNNAIALNTLGATFCNLRRFDDAEVCLKNAIALKPNHVEAYRNLGLICMARQEFDVAIGFFQAALEHNPSHFEILKATGNAFLHLEKPDKALVIFEKALSINARDANLQTDTGVAFQMQNQFREAMEFNSIAIAIDAGDNRHWAAFCACIAAICPNVQSDIDDQLIAIMDTGKIPSHDLMMPICGALYHRPEFREIIARYVQRTNASQPAEEEIKADIQKLSSIPLMLKLMSEFPITNLFVEKTLTALRKHILLNAAICESASEDFVTALALQCFNNEYSYAVTDDEVTALAAIKKEIDTQLTASALPSAKKLALVGCYEPLYKAFKHEMLAPTEFTSELDELLTRQVEEPRVEQELKADIPDLTGNANAVSESVRSQYEENPYPRWLRTELHSSPKTISECLQPILITSAHGAYDNPEMPEILVAGCGTGQHALQPATRFENARVTAVDLSVSSLAYGKRQAQKLGITNVEFARADILELANLGCSFDMIECVGVLHHLEDPLAGWKVLTKLLRPGGVMKIGLYSERARKDVIAGREIVAAQKFPATSDGMRRCRQFVIQEAANGNRELLQLTRRSDFFSLSAFRDLVFHVQEHRLDLHMVREHLEELNLEFLDFEMPFVGNLKTFRNSIKHLPQTQRLSHWHAYEEQHPDTFRGMYQFWCRKPKDAT
ncbi:MAG: tetratricopeptide repeat protein [Porticoccaceae bacterium]|uniref:tetratricopeptide repeat protein n=1 Tax=Thalassospira sp. TaxID=1912094 RepID=UPI003A8C1655